MKERQNGGTGFPLVFLMVSSTDHVTGLTGLTPAVTLSKNGGAFAGPSGTVAEVANGWYQVGGAGLATDLNTNGPLVLHATAAGADPTDSLYTVVPWNPFDAVRMGLTALPNAAASAAGGLPTFGTGAGQINPSGGKVPATLASADVSGTLSVNTAQIAGQTASAAAPVAFPAAVSSFAGGTVASVSGSVGSVAGNVGGNVVGSVGSVLATVTTVDPYTTQIVTSTSYSPGTAGDLFKRWSQIGRSGQIDNADGLATSLHFKLGSLAPAADGAFGTIQSVGFLTGTLAGQRQLVASYVGSTKYVTVQSAFTGIPADGDWWEVL